MKHEKIETKKVELKDNSDKITFKIVGINLLIEVILVILFIFRSYLNFGQTIRFSYSYFFTLLIVLQFLGNILLGIISAVKKNGRAVGYFLSASLMLLIGFGTCFYLVTTNF